MTIYANNDAKFVTTADPSFTVSYSPFVTGESETTAGVLTTTPTVSVDRTSTLNITNGSAASGVLPSSGSESAGTYASALVPSGAVAPNYQISYVKGSYTVVAAEQLLVRVQSARSVYGAAPSYTLSSAQYMPAGSSTPVTIGSVNVTGSAVAMNDGAGTTAAFNLTPLNATLSATQNTSVGSYQLGATGITIAPLVNPNFRSLTVVGDLSVTPKTLTPNANNATKVYDGTLSTTGLSIGLTGVVTSGALADTVSAISVGAFATRNAGATTYAISSLALTGADAGNYAISNAPISGAGTITAKTVTLAAPTGTKVYDGQTSYTVSAADLTALSAALGVAGDTVSSISLGFDNKNVGTSKTLTPTAVTVADGNSGNNYSVTLAANSSSAITRLSSVTWVGGSTGNYFDPANWAGGAVPDLSNVANVVIPAGTNVSFGSTVVAPAQSGAVNIDSLGGAAGALTQTDGTLNVGSGGVTLSGFTQSGGTLTSAGAVTLDTLAQTGGSLDAAGAFTVTQRFSQGTSGSITVGGNTRITNTTGGLVVGNLNTTGTTGITSTDGDITQATGTTLVSFGAATLVASSGGLPANITLTNAANDFVGAVSVSGANVALTDANASTLATVAATGDLSVTSTGALNLGTSTVGANLVANSNIGAITQTGALSVAGTSGLNAGTGNITLTNAANDFVGVVTSTGGVVNLVNLSAPSLGNSANDVAAQIKSALPANWPSAVAHVDATPPQPLVMASAAAASAAKASSTTETAGTSNSAGVTVDLQAPPDLSSAVMMMAAVSLPKGTSTVGAGFSFELPESVRSLASDNTVTETRLPNGSPLPAWLRFDAKALRFEANAVPDGAFPFQVVLTVGGQRVLVVISERAE